MFYRILFAFYLIIQVAGSARSQIIIDTVFNRYARQVPEQKIHLHFDNNVYNPGQTIWYKAYLFSGTEPANFSKNIYVDWYDDNGKYFTRTVSPVLNATAVSSFTIPADYTGKKLEAVAYTQWMLNFDTAFLYHRTITVAQPGKKEKPKHTGNKATLTFFPEGGDMVQGLLSTIAFKATDQAGYPVDVSGIIRGKSGEQIAEFSSRHDGMGMVKFIPDASDIYTAEWKDADTKTHTTVLPRAKQNGILLMIGKGFADRPFVIQRTEGVLESFKKLFLVVQSHGQIVYRANVNLTDRTQVNGKLPASQFPSGISQVTLFDINWQPIVERIVFVNNEEYRMDAEIKFDTVDISKRGRNVFQINVNDTIPATWSLAVTDDNSGYSSNNSIITDFLLSSDIKGYVHNPSYYFTSMEDSVAGHLDLVMLTNGWRRFKWQDVLYARKPSIIFPVDTAYLSIKGKIEGVSNTTLAKAKTVNLVLLGKDSSKQYLFLPVTPEGDFESSNLVLFDTAKVYFKLNQAPLYSKARMGLRSNLLQADTSKMIIVPDPQLMDPFMAKQELPDSVKNQLAAFMKKNTLQEVTVYAKTKTRMEELDEQYTSGMFKGNDGFQFDIANNPNASQSISIYHYLQSRVGGLRIQLPGIGSVSLSWQGAPTIVFLDEFEMTDPTALFNIPMNDVAYIKVFRPPFWGGFLGGAGGAVAVYTKKGSDLSKGLKGLDITSIAGYTATKEFYSPDYSLSNDQSISDTRRTLFWKSNIMTDAGRKKINIVFYNNDVTHNFRVVLEGMNDEGKLMHISKLLK